MSLSIAARIAELEKATRGWREYGWNENELQFFFDAILNAKQEG